MEMNFETAFYYLLSTIPQTLGALIALLGIFLLFKFESIKTTIIGFGKQSQNFYIELFRDRKIDIEYQRMQERLSNGIIRSDLETITSQITGIYLHFDKIVNEDKLKYEENSILTGMKHINEIQYKCLELRTQLIKKSKKILFLSGLLMFISVAFLLLVPIFSNSEESLIFLLILSSSLILWFGYCLIEMIKLIIISLKRDY